NHWSATGDWAVGKEAITLEKAGGKISYRFHARDVHLIMAAVAAGKSVRFQVRLGGDPPGNAHVPAIAFQGTCQVKEPRTYQLIRQHEKIVDRQFEIEFLDPGVEAFDFTFG